MIFIMEKEKWASIFFKQIIFLDLSFLMIKTCPPGSHMVYSSIPLSPPALVTLPHPLPGNLVSAFCELCFLDLWWQLGLPLLASLIDAITWYHSLSQHQLVTTILVSIADIIWIFVNVTCNWSELHILSMNSKIFIKI